MVCSAGLQKWQQQATGAAATGSGRRLSHLGVLDPHLAAVPRQPPPVAPVVAVRAQRQAPHRVLLQPLLQRFLRPPHCLLLLVLLALLGLLRLALQQEAGGKVWLQAGRAAGKGDERDRSSSKRARLAQHEHMFY